MLTALLIYAASTGTAFLILKSKYMQDLLRGPRGDDGPMGPVGERGHDGYPGMVSEDQVRDVVFDCLNEELDRALAKKQQGK